MLCLAFGVGAQALEESAPVALSRFERTVAYLQRAPAEQQTDFAITALAELVAVYMAEADLARAGSARPGGSPRSTLQGWAVAVDEYANQLLRVLDEVEQGQAVSLRLSHLGPAVVTVADRVVILGHPRADQQGAFEQQVLADFCSRHDCGPVTTAAATNARPEPIPVTVVRVNPVWAFAATGQTCSIDELQVFFNNSSNRNIATLRGICEQFVQELAALANELAGQQGYGVAIDWDGLALTATPGRPEHLVRVNAAGDSVLVTAPLLFASPKLLADIRPWLAARVGGKPAPAVRLDAASYGWLEQ
ncbi:MAG: hypothetical protein KA159_08985 [Halioglobus sp.]|nr:hypothetical protein [Halioglobus sp.]